MRAAAARRRLHAYCLTHAVRFAVQAQDGAIECDAAPHLLTENYPSSAGQFVELCTACDTLWPFSAIAPASQCLHCAIVFGQRSLCRTCSVFTLSPADTAAARCAGCGEARTGEQLHSCPEIGMFSSAREECPFCTSPIALMPRGVEPLPASNDLAPSAPPMLRPGGKANLTPVPTVLEAVPAPPARRSALWAIGVAAVAIPIVVIFSMDSFPEKIDRALASQHYFPPPRESVYEIYMAEAKANPASQQVVAAAARIVGKLGPEADQHLQTFYRDSQMELGWAQLERYYAFLSTLAPNDVAYKVKSAYTEGQRHLLDARDHRAAYECYRRALAYDDTFVLALNGIAKLYMQDSSPFRDEREAVRYYELAAAADPNFTWALKNLGEYYLQREDWARAEDYMSRALRTAPTRASILGALGRISYRRQRLPAALDYYTRARQHASTADEIRRFETAIAQVRARLR